MKRNLSIDLVKVIAMFMVMAIHIHRTGIATGSWILKCNSAVTVIAIPLFFMVSGYLLSGKQLSLDYSKRKIKGILRFVFITITIFVLSYFILYDHIKMVPRPMSTTSVIGSYVSWTFQRGLLWQYWYFGAMIIIYAMGPIFTKIFQSNNLPYFIIGCVIISFCFFVLDCKYNFEKSYIRQTFRVWYWFMYFLLGGYIRLNRGGI